MSVNREITGEPHSYRNIFAMANSSRLRPGRPGTGFYHALNCVSTADAFVTDTVQKRRLVIGSEDDGGSSGLPFGCFKVKRLVSKRLKGISRSLYCSSRL